MNLLSVNNLAKSFGEFKLFKHLSFGIDKGDKVALVAQNGSGKSTILNILKGLDLQDEGTYAFRDAIRVSFLEQEPLVKEQTTCKEFILEGNHPQLQLVKAYDKCLQDGDTGSNHFNQLMEQMEEQNAWDVEVRINEVLQNLGFPDTSRIINNFSGGEKRRLALAKALVEEPDLLFLDEPTNHLDFAMVEWLEQFLSGTSITFLLITHDRYFLDNVCNKLIELTPEGAFVYQGNYEYFLTKKAERSAQLDSTIQKAKNLFSTELEWLRRMPKARGTKSKSRVDAAHELEKVAKTKVENKSLDIASNMTRLGKKIINLEHIDKHFPDKVILKDFSYQFQRSEKVGIIGNNGVGKSTLLNIIAGLDKEYSGLLDIGETVKVGYYTQKGLSFKEDSKVIDVVKDVAEYIPQKNGDKISATQLLQNFNFSPPKQYVTVSKLSGGEKKRLNLVKVLMDAPNFLILDEPTNDLDLLTLQALESYLLNFEGCVLVVSHDRYFLDRIVDHLLVLKGEGEVQDFPGSYTQFRALSSLEEKQDKKIKEKSVEAPKEVKSKPVKEGKKLSFKEQKELEDIEAKIEGLEQEKNALTERLNVLEGEELLSVSKQLGEIVNQIEALTLRWMELV